MPTSELNAVRSASLPTGVPADGKLDEFLRAGE
jgi:hypothetical protein